MTDLGNLSLERGLENQPIHSFFLSLFKKSINLFMRDTEREGETQAEGEAGSLRGAQCGDLILGLWDHALSQRQMLNR